LDDGGGSEAVAEYKYCDGCGGDLYERTEYGESTKVERFVWQGLQAIAVQEKIDDGSFEARFAYMSNGGQIGQVCMRRDLESHSATGSVFYMYDALGNVAGVYWWDPEAGESGELVSKKFAMDAWGNEISVEGYEDWSAEAGTAEHLTTKRHDPSTDLYYFHARWYDGEVGQFVSVDPMIYKNNILYSKHSNYNYVNCNPINLIDINGEVALGPAIGFGLILIGFLEMKEFWDACGKLKVGESHCKLILLPIGIPFPPVDAIAPPSSGLRGQMILMICCRYVCKDNKYKLDWDFNTACFSESCERLGL